MALPKYAQGAGGATRHLALHASQAVCKAGMQARHAAFISTHGHANDGQGLVACRVLGIQDSRVALLEGQELLHLHRPTNVGGGVEPGDAVLGDVHGCLLLWTAIRQLAQ